MSNKRNQFSGGGLDSSWIPVLFMLFFMWPIGMIMLYNKLKKLNSPNQRNRKPISFMSVAMCVIGAAMIFGARAPMGLFALLGGLSVFGFSRKMKVDERRYDKYLSIVGDRPMAPVSAIAAAMPATFDEAKADLQRMIDEGYFGKNAYIDDGNGMFVKDSRAALSHLGTLHQRFERAKIEEMAAPTAPKKAASAPQNPSVPEDEYQKNLAKIRHMDDLIQDEDISKKIRRIESVTADIFAAVKKKPERRNEIRTFMNYYLPTTMKLLDAYATLEKQSAPGQNILSAKENIEKTLDMLVYAFEGQLDRMFESEARDISTDITVLERMMAKDGLTENNPYSFPPMSQRTQTSTGSATATQQKPE